MNRFARLLDDLVLSPSRGGKLRLLAAHFREVPDPDRGWALAALTGALDFRHATPAVVRRLAASRIDPVLFALSHDYVGDLAETVALTWPAAAEPDPPSVDEIVRALAAAARADVPGLLAGWLDRLDAAGRWALLKLVTGALRVASRAVSRAPRWPSSAASTSRASRRRGTRWSRPTRGSSPGSRGAGPPRRRPGRLPSAR